MVKTSLICHQNIGSWKQKLFSNVLQFIKMIKVEYGLSLVRSGNISEKKFSSCLKNHNFIGDLCDVGPDTDNDGVVDGADNCVSISNSDQLDTDYDGNF